MAQARRVGPLKKNIPGSATTTSRPTPLRQRVDAVDSSFMNPIYKPKASPAPLTMPGLGISPTQLKRNTSRGGM